MVKIIGVVGAGTMGNGIAQIAAEAGYQVIMRDIDASFVQRGLATISKNLQRLLPRVSWQKRLLRRLLVGLKEL